MRAFWSGEITFGLVTIPAKLYSASKDGTPQFKQLHTACACAITMVRRCPKCDKDLGWEEIGKGYEVSKGEYALFTKEELAALDDEPGGTIEIVGFVNPAEVDLAYVDKSNWVAPGGKNTRGFALLRAAMEQTGKVGVAKVKLRTRTRMALLRPRGGLFSLDLLRFAEELVDGAELEPAPERKPISDREKDLALSLVEELSGPFDLAKHPDEYRAKVLVAVEEKVAAGGVVSSEAPVEAPGVAPAPALDLSELLSRSIKKAAPKAEAPKATGTR